MTQELLRSQTNAIFEAIKSGGLDPNHFSIEKRPSLHDPGTTVSSIVHGRSGYFYTFDYLSDKEYAEYSPGEAKQVVQNYPGSWGLQFDQFIKWLDYLKREIESPDFWSTANYETLLVEAANSATLDNSFFSGEEQGQIAAQLIELRQFILETQGLQAAQSDFVAVRLNYLEDASTRQSKTDWLHTAIGVLFSVTLSLSLSGDEAREIFRFAARLFSSIFGDATTMMLP